RVSEKAPEITACEAITVPVFSSHPRLGGLSAGRARLDGYRDRLAGGDLRRLFTDPSGGATRLFAADAGSPHLRADDRAGLRSRDEPDTAGGGCGDGPRVPLLGCARRRLRHRGHRHDDGRYDPRLHLFSLGGGMAVMAAG